MKTDIEIAQSTKMEEISKIAKKLGLKKEEISLYGNYKAKIDYNVANKKPQNGKVILVTATTPTPYGEGKTTTSIGLADALSSMGKKALVCLREPSLGPVFGMKGGATGGGYSQVVPMEDINLHFTGDIHAIECANNLLAAMIDNSIYQGNPLNIDPHKVVWKRCMDMNDRQLRNIVDGIGYSAREDGFDITVASEIMAIFCLAKDLEDLKTRISRIICAYNYNDEPVTAEMIGATGSMVALLKDAFNPNLVQTLEHTPAIIHGGPFANIAHGCNSVVATKLGMSLADYVVTEAGFGADLGAEKFLDIKCRTSGIKPSCVVLVTTIRALKYHGGCEVDLKIPNVGCVQEGLPNLERHLYNLKHTYKLPVVIAVNQFEYDTQEEYECVKSYCDKLGIKCVLNSAFKDGSSGATDLAKAVLDSVKDSEISYPYYLDEPIYSKITKIAKFVYHANEVNFSAKAVKMMEKIEKMGYGNLPVCIAKTQYSFSDNPKLLNAPEGFEMKVNEIRLSAGAGFVVAICGNIMTMPGLPKNPVAENIDVVNGKITGLF